MKKLFQSRITGLAISSILLIIFFLGGSLLAGGISIDAGLTPPKDRWIFRTQIRYMERNNNPTMTDKKMTMYMHPIVLVYGLRSDLTLMLKQVIARREMDIGSTTTKTSGFTDLFFMVKYRLTRINTKKYSIGIAPTIGLDIPTGRVGFSSDSYNLHLGLFVTAQKRAFGVDFNLKYVWNSASKTNGSNTNFGDEIEIKSALNYQKSFGENADYAIAPVFETHYSKISANKFDGTNITNTGESFFFLSPGLKFTYASFILEGLLQFPVWQKQEGIQTERDTGFLIGIRLMY